MSIRREVENGLASLETVPGRQGFNDHTLEATIALYDWTGFEQFRAGVLSGHDDPEADRLLSGLLCGFALGFTAGKHAEQIAELERLERKRVI